MGNDKYKKEELKQKTIIEEFIASTNLFIAEYYLEDLEEKLRITAVFLNTCESWIIDEKDDVIEKLNDLELALFNRIKLLKPDAVMDL